MKASVSNCVIALFISLGLTAVLSSCKKENDPPQNSTPVPGNPKGTLLLHLHTFIDETEVDLYGIEYASESGRLISLDRAQLYISGIELIREDGSVYQVSGRNILKVLESDSYVVGEVPTGTYRSLRFSVGLSPETNGLEPAESPDSLILDKPAMWFSSAPQPDGYIYFNLKGSIDTTSEMTGELTPFDLRIGTPSHYTQVNMPVQVFTIEEGQPKYVHMIVDYYRIFSGIDLSNPDNLNILTVADNATENADEIADNLPLMFRYE